MGPRSSHSFGSACLLLATFLSCLLLWRDCPAEGSRFLLEPGFQIGGALQTQRFQASRLRFSADVGWLFWLGSDTGRRSGVGITLQGSFADSDGWRAWLAENREQIFFTDVGGYKFLVAPTEYLAKSF